jgi:hypothetical protein
VFQRNYAVDDHVFDPDGRPMWILKCGEIVNGGRIKDGDVGGGNPPGEYQWLAPIQEHHDHRSDNGIDSPRFFPALVCGDCNSADGRVKRLLKLPSEFSFSPTELSQFITGDPHGGVKAGMTIAKRIYTTLIPIL